MAARKQRASLSRGRSGWCLIYRHPVAMAADGKQKLRVRRGLGTRDEAEAQGFVDELNLILADETLWSTAAQGTAAARFSPVIVSAFYDYLSVDRLPDGWDERESRMPLPNSEDGFVKIQLVGTTGAGKTTLVRQLLGTDPDTERFPSTSAAKTTVADLEVIADGDDFSAVVTFVSRSQARFYIMECVSSAVAAAFEDRPASEVSMRLLTHAEQRFRLNYLLGKPAISQVDEDEEDEEVDTCAENPATSLVSSDDRIEFAAKLQAYLIQVGDLAIESKELFLSVATEFGINLSRISSQDREALRDLVYEQLQENENFHRLTDEILDEVESRFDFIEEGEFSRSRDNWPTVWTVQCNNRSEFLASVNRFTSNYEPHFGRLLTPLVEGIRVRGPFHPKWYNGDETRIVLFDGQGLGHTADSASSISTTITKRFRLADVILLVDGASQPMQAAPQSVLHSIVSSGYESKLLIGFTRFDEVKGDNLVTITDRKEHVATSYLNAIHHVGKQLGQESEDRLKRLFPSRLFYFANAHQRSGAGQKLTRNQITRLLEAASKSIESSSDIVFQPRYDLANLVLAAEKATNEFQDRWKTVLGRSSGMTSRAEPWQRVKALNRRIAMLNQDEYLQLQPVADLISMLQMRISVFLANPVDWEPSVPPEESETERLQAIDAIRRLVNERLHDFAKKRVIGAQIKEWIDAYNLRGNGSTSERAKKLSDVYEMAAPIPNEMPSKVTTEFLNEFRTLVVESIQNGGGLLHDWSLPTSNQSGVAK